MSPLVRLCCALAALTLGAALYTNTVFSSAGSRPPGADATVNVNPTAYAFPAAEAATPPSVLISVNSLSDAAANDGLCTLREAITSANTKTASGAATGECPAGGTNTNISVTLPGKIILTSALPAITSVVNINGPGGGDLAVSGNNAYRVFNIAAGATVAISSLTVSEGSAYSGAGIDNSGKLTLSFCAVTNNNAARADSTPPFSLGGGINNNSGGVLDINNCAVYGNSTGNFFGDGGGGLYNDGTATLTNTTVSANTAVFGGGIGGRGALTLKNTTVTANHATYAGGGVQYQSNVGATLGNTIIAGNAADSSGADCSGSFNSDDYNLIGNGAGCTLGGATAHNLTGVDARLGPLQNNGGPTPTHALLPGSPAIDAGNGTPGADQRGFSRPVNFVTVADAAGGNGSDIGAFEAGPTELLVVNSLLDTNDNSCDAQNCTLREALNAANANSDQSAIYFSVTGTINLSGALPGLGTPFVNAPLTINGPGANLLTVRRDTGGDYRIFSNFSRAFITGLTVTNGRTADGLTGDQPVNIGGHGGGILNAGTLTLTDVVVTGNRTGDGGAAGGTSFGGFGGFGGGISSSGVLTMTNVTVSNNTTGHGGGGDSGGPGGLGGGIQVTGTLNMTHCSVTGNSTGTGSVGSSGSGQGGSGGGIYGGDATNFNSATINLTDTVVSGNHTADGAGPNADGGHGGGVLLEKGAGTLTNVTVSNNSTGNGAAPTPGPNGFPGGQGGFGGGVFNHSLATMSVTGSTVSGNSTGTNGFNGGGMGGGVLNSGTLNVTDSTISGNTTNGSGGMGAGLWNAGTTTLTNCTVAFNNAAATIFGGAGIHTFTSPYVVNLRNTIVARNTLSGGANGPDVAGTMNSLGFNLVGNADGSGGAFTNGVNGDQVGTTAAPLNPRLAALGNYAGATQTHALLPGSPAVNAGTSTGAPAADQRGVGRVGAFDIGAFESRGFQIAAASGTPQSAPIKTTFGTALAATVNSAFGEPVSGGLVTFSAPASGASGTFAASAAVAVNSGGVATAPAFTANATAGSYNVTASANSSSATFALTNLKGAQVIGFGPLPSRTFGDAPFTVGATGGGSSAAVTFGASGNCTQGGTNGSTITLTGAGNCNVTASQNGDDNYNPASPVQQSFQIAKAATASAVSSSSNPSAPGQPVTFTATVTSTAGTPTGSVQFKADGADLGSAPLNSGGVATLTTSGLTAAEHSVTADYGGDSNFNSSSGALVGGQVIGAVVEFTQSSYAVFEVAGSLTVTVRRTGDTSGAAEVDYATEDGTGLVGAAPCSALHQLMLDRCDFARALGTLHFAAGETEKTVTILINDDSYYEGMETAMLKLSNPSAGVSVGSHSSASLLVTDQLPESTINPIDDDETFVRQHYRDFLNREADADGLKFWTDGIKACGADAGCREVKRIDTSAAFFLSIEFQETGYLAYRTYKAAFGDGAAPARDANNNRVLISVPLIRLGDFLADTRRLGEGVVVNQGDWQQRLDANKQAYALEFVQRSQFVSMFPLGMTAAEFVAKLNQNAGGVLTQNEIETYTFQLAAAGPATAEGRAGALRLVAENAALRQRETNRAFVLMQFFGYLRRNPSDAPEAGLDYTGWKFWLNKLEEFGGDFRRAEMVKAFITSVEYRQRFGQ